MSKKNNTFIVKVIKEENHSWQGSVTFVETNETQHFRSTMELLHLMEGGLKDDQA